MLSRHRISTILLVMFLDTSRAAGGLPDGLLAEATERLQQYLRLDTTNPPGNEMVGARFLEELLKKEGFEPQVFEVAPGRGNVMARWKGTGRGRPVILLHHIDVVPAEKEYWKVPPFEGRVVDGHVYGRGAADIKGKGIVDLMTMVHLKRQGKRLGRDVIFLAVADEEEGGLGSKWMVKEKGAELREAEFLLDEGGTVFTHPDGRARRYMVSLAEKSAYWLELTFRGPAGHASIPLEGTALERAVRAAGRLMAHRPATRVLPGLAGYLEMLVEGKDLAAMPGWRGSLAPSLEDPSFREALAAADPRVNSALRSTICVTQITGSDKINSIANQAVVGIDCRLLPGEAPEPFLTELRKVIDDPTVEIAVKETPSKDPVPASAPDSVFMKSLQVVASRRDPGVPVVPYILPSSTDAVLFRTIGIQTYGFEPYRLTDEEYDRSHGNDERLGVASLGAGIELLAELLEELAGVEK